MGTCASKSEVSRSIDTKAKILQKGLSKQIKILLLGPGESGKSTIFKQLKLIQDNGGFTTEELSSFKSDIYSNCISQMKCLLEYVLYSQIPLSNDSLQGAQLLIQNTANVWTPDIGQIIKQLWNEKDIKAAYDQHDSRFLINDTASYFFDNIDRINSPDYQPTTDDILRVRVRSQGIEEAEFVFDRRTFKFVDVGGQRSQRRKWIHCFDDVSAVLYCSSLTEYDLALREDPRINRLEDSRALFTEVCHQPSFQNRTIIFFLNKLDLFREKLPRCPLQAHQSGYTPPIEDIECNLEIHVNAACQYIKELFLACIDQEQRDIKGTIYVHFTCALDTRQIEYILKLVRKTLLDDLIDELGV